MKRLSVILLSFMLFTSHAAIADITIKIDNGKKGNNAGFKQAKNNTLDNVSAHIKVLNVFRDCVQASKRNAEIDTCREKKNQRMKVLSKL